MNGMPKELTAKEIAELGIWCCEQRLARIAGELSPVQIAKLDSHGFNWDACKTCRVCGVHQTTH